jgi:hypothetical protein
MPFSNSKVVVLRLWCSDCMHLLRRSVLVRVGLHVGSRSHAMFAQARLSRPVSPLQSSGHSPPPPRFPPCLIPWTPHDIVEHMRPLEHSCASKVLDEAGAVVPRSWSMVPAVTVNIHGAPLKGPRWLGGQ